MEFSMQTAFKYLYILLHSTPSFPEDLTSVFLLLLNLNSLFVPSHMHAFYNTNTRNNLFTSTTSLLSTKLHQYQWHEFESAPLKQEFHWNKNSTPSWAKKGAVLKFNSKYNHFLREMFAPLAKPAVSFRQAVSHFPWNVFLVPFISKANFHKFYLTSVNSGLSSVCYTFSLLTSNYQYHPTEVPKTEPSSLWGSDWNPYVLSTTNLLEESVPYALSCTSNYSRLWTSKYNIAWVLRNSNLTKDNTLKTRVESYLVAAMLSPWLYPIKQRAVIFKEFWFQRPEDSKGRLQRWKFAFLIGMLTFIC